MRGDVEMWVALPPCVLRPVILVTGWIHCPLCDAARYLNMEHVDAHGNWAEAFRGWPACCVVAARESLPKGLRERLTRVLRERAAKPEE